MVNHLKTLFPGLRGSRYRITSPPSVPLHVARQLPSGRWSSKLGALQDIEHDLHDLEGTEYGSVVLVMKRTLPATIG